MNTKTTLVLLATCVMLLTVGCKNEKGGKAITVGNISDDKADADSTIFGVCGENTAMHTLELIGDDGVVRNYIINLDDSTGSVVFGGLLTGDRMAVTAKVEYGDTIATKVINLTTLLGEWLSLDKNFDIQEGGTVASHVETETNPWTSWKIFNGMLVLNKDTFDIIELGADSLYMENNDGVFAYKRKRK